MIILHSCTFVLTSLNGLYSHDQVSMILCHFVYVYVAFYFVKCNNFASILFYTPFSDKYSCEC